MEFDKSRVFTALNADELKPGDKVIVAGNVGTLKWSLNYERIETLYKEIVEIKGEDEPVRFVVKAYGHDSKTNDYALAYLVERAENCTNCALKNSMQSCRIALSVLHKCKDYNPETEPKAEKHYRPFRDTDELIKVWMDGGKYDYKEMPHIWIRQKNCSKGGLLITYFGEDEVRTDMGFLTMSKLLSDYTFTDGSLCGVEE